ncbi:hypothetical protein Tco_1127868, partial [Tanacetum coccineum]
HLPVGPDCLAAAAAELSLTSHSGLGVVSSSLFRGLRNISSAAICGGRIRGAKKNGGSGGVGASSSASTKSSACSVETDITQKDEKQSQKRQNQARNGKV